MTGQLGAGVPGRQTFSLWSRARSSRWARARLCRASCASRSRCTTCCRSLVSWASQALCSCSSSPARGQACPDPWGGPAPQRPAAHGPLALGRLQASGTEPPDCSAGVCLDGSPHGWGGLSRGRVTGGGQGLPHGPCDRAHSEPWAGSRPGGRPPVADSSGRGSRMTLDVSSRRVWPRWGAVSGSRPWGTSSGKGAEGAHRGSTLQGLPGQPCTPGLSLHLLLLCLQLHCQLLGLKEAALQGVPLGPAESSHHRRVTHTGRGPCWTRQPGAHLLGWCPPRPGRQSEGRQRMPHSF